jgi:hypothetical protein
MRTYVTTKTMRTVCGKTLSYLEVTGQLNKMHSTEGPAVVYAEEEKKAPEYYLFGIKYSKNEWKSLINQHKPLPVENAMGFSPEY